MNKTVKRGRPRGTTRANGFKVAVDSNSYWLNRYKEDYTRIKPSTIHPSFLENMPTPTEVSLDKKVDFMSMVKSGLDNFLKPYNV